jgi:hypothetical protein
MTPETFFGRVPETRFTLGCFCRLPGIRNRFQMNPSFALDFFGITILTALSYGNSSTELLQCKGTLFL